MTSEEIHDCFTIVDALPLNPHSAECGVMNFYEECGLCIIHNKTILCATIPHYIKVMDVKLDEVAGVPITLPMVVGIGTAEGNYAEIYEPKNCQFHCIRADSRTQLWEQLERYQKSHLHMQRIRIFTIAFLLLVSIFTIILFAKSIAC